MRTADARALVTGFLAASPAGGWLPEAKAAELLSCYGIPLAVTMSAASEQEAVEAAAKLGGRVVLKPEAEGLVHRTHAGDVTLDLRTPEEVAEGYRALTADFGSRLHTVLVQPMLTGGFEVLIGVVQEPVFGPLVVFGSGGAATDMASEHVTRLTPLTDADADEMIHAARAAARLFGDQGAPPVDTAALADALLRVSRLADDLPEASELDLNPVVAREDGVYCVDVRVQITPAEPRDPFLRRLSLSTPQRADSRRRIRSATPESPRDPRHRIPPATTALGTGRARGSPPRQPARRRWRRRSAPARYGGRHHGRSAPHSRPADGGAVTGNATGHRRRSPVAACPSEGTSVRDGPLRGRRGRGAPGCCRRDPTAAPDGA